MKTIALLIAIAGSGCFPVHDYEGDYEMTYDVTLSPSGIDKVDVRAGLADVELRHGLAEEYLLDLGSSLCRLEGLYVEAKRADDWPYLDIRPQTCWYAASGKTYELMLSGTATFSESERLSIVLAGSFVDDVARVRGSATVELTESW